MTPEKWDNVKAILDKYLGLPESEKAAYLTEICGADADLRREVERLIDSYDEEDQFLEDSAVAEVADEFFEHEISGNKEDSSDDSPSFKKGHLLKGRYEIVRQLGKGGMGEVFLAFDSKLNRNVSLKVLHSDVASNNDRLQRFEQEARAVSALNHPHILTIYEFDKTSGGVHFIVGEYVNGVTLNEYRRREELSLGKVLEIAIQAASALSAAHEVGIVHRDIKPDNIMVRRDGYIKVLDFGLAKLLRQPRSGSSDPEEPTIKIHKTSPGAIMGTASYMSPEQARGIDVDARSDLWSLGVVVYELLTGKRPFNGDTTADILAEVLREEPLPLSTYTENAPPELEWIISKVLSKKLEGRYQTADELKVDLEKIKRQIEFSEDSHRSSAAEFKRRGADGKTEQISGDSTAGDDPLTTAGDNTSGGKYFRSQSSIQYLVDSAKTNKGFAFLVLIVLSALIGLTAYYFAGSTPEPAGIRSVAVLPFKNLSREKDLAFLADGVSENLINQLSRLPQLKVISRNSSFQFRDAQEDLSTVAAKLGVRAVITGSVYQLGDELVVKFEIVDTDENRQLAGEEFRRKAGDLVKIQSEIPVEIADFLNLKLSGFETTRISQQGTENSEAFRYYLSGLVEVNGPQNILGNALEYFQKAVELDPNFAEARVEIASIYWQRANASGNPGQLMPKVKQETEKALSVNPNLAKGHVMRAAVSEYEFAWKSAEDEYLRAIELNPNLDFARNNYAFFLTVAGRHDEALKQLDELKARDPINVRQFLTTKGIILAWARKFDDALREFQKVQAVEQTVKVEDFSLGYVYAGKGLNKEASEHFKSAVELVGGDDQYSLALVFLAASYARIPDKRAEAEKISRKLENMTGYVSPAALAIVYTALGENDKAIASLEKAYLERDVQLRFIGVGYEYDGLRNDARFLDLLKRLALAK